MQVEEVLAERGGYATRRTLLRHVTRHAICRALDEGRVVVLQRGVYGLGVPDGLGRVVAAATALRGVASHDTAAVLWDLEMVHRPGLHVTVPRQRSRAAFPGATVHRADVGPTEVRRGVEVTSVLRTVLDCARSLPLPDGVVIADSALRRGLVGIDELRAAAAAERGPGAGRIRRVAALADPRCGSALESLLRVLLVEAGLAPEVTQFCVVDERGALVAVADFAWRRQRLLVEADGYEFHRSRADYRNDRRKANAFCRLGWRLLRFSWEDVRHDPDYVVAAVRCELTKPAPRGPRRTTNTQKAA